jgi:hypothetical protein
MKITNQILGVAILGMVVFVVGCGHKQKATFQSLKNPEVAVHLKSFIVGKEAQADAAIQAGRTAMPADFKNFFVAAERGDWLAVSNAFLDLGKRIDHLDGTAGPDFSSAHGTQWEAVKEVWGVFNAFAIGDGKYSAAFGADIIASIPPGGIYFGGTDAGRFIVTTLQKSQVDGDPFFTLAQNAFADGVYLDYLRSMYGGKIYVPTYEDSEKCFIAYKEDARKRLQNHQLKPGEDVSQDSNGQLKISGQVAVMEINWLMVKTIFDQNTNHEFYIDEGFPPGDWIYPHLEPHGLIMKINRQLLVELSDETVQHDHDYWTKCVEPMIGNWLETDTSVEKVSAFAEQIYLRHDFSGFKGDPQFVQNDYSRTMFSLPRSAIAGLYVWRMNQVSNPSEKERMAHEADFAFRQAIALCPYLPAAVFRYVNFLLSQNRVADALLIAKTPAEIGNRIPYMKGNQYSKLVQQLEQYQPPK